MISPVPPGHDPNNSKCGECGGQFTMPFIRTEKDEGGFNVQVYALKCRTDPDHRTYQKKNSNIRKMMGPDGPVEIDIMTGREVSE